MLIVFEGLDQSGKQTQAERLAAHAAAAGREVHVLSFPDYATAIGGELARALRGEREYAPDVMQLLYIANRYEHRPRIEAWLARGAVVIADRYLASSVAYGEAQGLDPAWLGDVQRYLPQPDATVLLDVAPETSLARKRGGRDRYERDLALLARVRESYRRQAAAGGWHVVPAEGDRDAVFAEVLTAVGARLAPR